MFGKRGQVVLYIYFFIAMIILVTIAAVLAPMGVRFNSAMYTAGEGILADAQPDIDAIQDASIRTAINESVTAAKSAGQNNVEVNAAIFQYSWVLVLILIAVILFIQSRRLIEVGRGGFV